MAGANDLTVGEALEDIAITMQGDVFWADLANPVLAARKKIEEDTDKTRQQAASLLSESCKQISKLQHFMSERVVLEKICKLLQKGQPRLSTSLPGIQTTGAPGAPRAAAPSLSEGMRVQVIQDFMVLIRECNAIDLQMLNADMENALGSDGRVSKVDPEKSTVEVEGIGWVPIKALKGFGGWRKPKDEAKSSFKSTSAASTVPLPPPPKKSDSQKKVAPKKVAPPPRPMQPVAKPSVTSEAQDEDESEFTMKPGMSASPDEFIKILLGDQATNPAAGGYKEQHGHSGNDHGHEEHGGDCCNSTAGPGEAGKWLRAMREVGVSESTIKAVLRKKAELDLKSSGEPAEGSNPLSMPD